MIKFLMLLLSVCIVTNSFANEVEKEYTEEEVKKLVEEASRTHITKSGLDLSLPKEYRSSYRVTDEYKYDDFADANRNSVVFTKGKSHFIPFDPTGADMWKIAAASTAAVIFFANDGEVMDFVQNHKNEFTEKVAWFGEGFGSEWPMYAAAGGYILGVVMKDDGTKSYALMAAKSMLISSVATYALKNVFHRVRPSGGDPNNWEGMNGKFGSNVSFPSGHTTLAFSAATYIAETNKHRGPLIPILAYSVAAISAYSRVHDKAHWGSDVIMGALIGHLVTKSVLNAKTAEKGFVITPSVDFNGGFHISVTYTGRPKKSASDCGRRATNPNERLRLCIEAAFNDSKY